MKKCPECGNPSYDGAPVCGNCGYKFPKPKVIAPRREDIFQPAPKIENDEDDEDIIKIVKENKVIIGAILIVTLIVIGAIFLIGSNNTNDSNSTLSMDSNDLKEFSGNGFTFKYPKTWKKISGSDAEHPGAVFFKTEDNVTIEYYNISTSAKSLKDITQQRINYAQQKGDYVELVETITLDGRNSSNILLENADGNYTRYVSMFSNGELYVYKLSGSSENSLTSEIIDSAISSSDIA